jgi:hypothetical protein
LAPESDSYWTGAEFEWDGWWADGWEDRGALEGEEGEMATGETGFGGIGGVGGGIGAPRVVIRGRGCSLLLSLWSRDFDAAAGSVCCCVC